MCICREEGQNYLFSRRIFFQYGGKLMIPNERKYLWKSVRIAHYMNNLTSSRKDKKVLMPWTQLKNEFFSKNQNLGFYSRNADLWMLEIYILNVSYLLYLMISFCTQLHVYFISHGNKWWGCTPTADQTHTPQYTLICEWKMA